MAGLQAIKKRQKGKGKSDFKSSSIFFHLHIAFEFETLNRIVSRIDASFSYTTSKRVRISAVLSIRVL